MTSPPAHRRFHAAAAAAMAIWLAMGGLLQTSMAANFEKLVMPGRVIAGHAEFEDDCGACHDAESEEARPLLCTTCHEGIGADRVGGNGFHGRFDAARRSDCTACHGEHEGRDADIVNLDSGIFDHALTDFPLDGAHQAVACGACHEADTTMRDAPQTCGSCHADDDAHERQLGTDCGDCHARTSWQEALFEHASTGYTLTGAHVEVACGDCHQRNRFDQATADCVSCHAVDDAHGGSRGSECDSCHNTKTWGGAGFDHARVTGFPLREGHAGLACGDCHERSDHRDDLAGGCVACHAGDDLHQGRLGADCAGCHSAASWALTTFDHDATDFPLADAHANLNCTACHKTGLEESPPSGCGDCHAFQDVHQGRLDGDCSSCHSEQAWTDPVRFDHDLADFPLLGMHAAVACSGCHADNAFRGAPRDCVSCHEDDDPHDGSLGEVCAACHSSNSWAAGGFDHDTDTDFPLAGAHDALECKACHADPAAAAQALSVSCGACHRADDVHDGQFGTNCGSCHGSSSFSVITGPGRTPP